MSNKIKLVSFDFDLTLTKFTSAMEHFSIHQKISDKMDLLEKQFWAGEVNTSQFSDASAGYFKGLSFTEIDQIMQNLTLIDDCRTTIDTIRQMGIEVIICSVGYRTLISPIAKQLDVETFGGVNLTSQNDVFTGEITSYFSQYNKITFVQQYALKKGIELENVMAVGDSETDVPLFNVVGNAIAFNAREGVHKHAHQTIDSESLKPILDYI